MKINQLLYGYREGHRLLAGSIELSDSLVWELVRATDRPSVSEVELEEGVTFGFKLDKNYYALCRTWAAKEINRPGAVWTHVLLVPDELKSPLECLSLLHDAKQPNENKFLKPLIYNELPLLNNQIILTAEVANLLMLFAAKPKSGLQAVSLTSPIKLLANAQRFWRGLLHNQSFSTSAGKKDIAVDEKAVIIMDKNLSIDFTFGGVCLSDLDVRIPSARITKAWKILRCDPLILQMWLSEASNGIGQTASNLKLVMEALLLGSGELDDNKLLKRISNAVGYGENASILCYSLGSSLIDVPTPPVWVVGLFLMGEENWDKWVHLVNAKKIGASAAKAPYDVLANRINNMAKGNNAHLALEEVSKVIKPDTFNLLYNFSENAASILIKLNPDLLFSLSKVDKNNRKLAAIATGQDDRDLLWDLELLSRAPNLWRSILASGIRLTRSNKDLINYASRRIIGGTWGSLSSVTKSFLKETPNIVNELLYSSPSDKVLKTLVEEFGGTYVDNEIEHVLKKNRARSDEIADSLVAIYGPLEEISAINNISGDLKSAFVASISEARWRRNHNAKVLNRIKIDLADQVDSSVVVDLIKDKNLQKSLIAEENEKDSSRAKKAQKVKKRNVDDY